MGYLKMCPYKNKDLGESGLFQLIEMQPSDELHNHFYCVHSNLVCLFLA